jgi:peroxiredoxin
MRTRLLALFFIPAVSLAAEAALEAGDMAPGFDATASLDGTSFEFSLDDALEDGPVVVYFYPSAYTRGCNMQARHFAVNMDRFNAAGASVIGVSLDSIERLNDFSADPEYCAGKLAVASDADGSIARAYGLDVRETPPGRVDTRGNEITHGRAERVTFVVTPNGRIAEMIGGLSPTENVEKALQAVEALRDRAAD